MRNKGKKKRKKWYLDKYENFDFDNLSDEDFNHLLPKLKTHLAIRYILIWGITVSLILLFVNSF